MPRRRPSRRLALVLAVAALGLLAVPQSAAAAKASKLQRALDALVAGRGGPPAVSVLIRRGGRSEFLRAGLADVRGGRRPTPVDRMRIASVSKGFNALIAARLARRGLLGLDEPLGQRLPQLLPAAGAVTLRQLLQHTSGLADYIRQPGFLKAFTDDPAAYLAPWRLIGYVRDLPLEFPPGTRYHYSDSDNIAAAMLEEAASGRSYEQLLAAEVVRPLGMRASSLPRTTAIPRPYLHGYEVEPGKRPEDVSRLVNPSGAWASGGIVSTPRDLSRFLPSYVRTLLAASRELSDPFRPGSSSPPGPGRNSAGIGIFRYRARCGTVYGHTGSFPGYRMLIAASANGRRSVVFAVNAQIVPGRGADRVAKAITRAQALAVCHALR